MTRKDASSTVQHRPDLSRFQTSEGAYLEYRFLNDTLSLEHTFVPDDLRGRGLASQLAKAGLEFVRQSGRQAIINCDYVCGYIKRHPEYEDLVTDLK